MSGTRRGLRAGAGEEICFDGEGDGARIHSRGGLPLRVRAAARHHGAPGLPGTAVVLGEQQFEVVGEVQAEDGAVLYSLRPWPEGEVVRHRVVYGHAFVHAVQMEREHEIRRRRLRHVAWLAAPVIGFLPEEEQIRTSDYLGVDSRQATLAAALVECAGVLVGAALLVRAWPFLVLAVPGLALLAMPAAGRAYAAAFQGVTAGSRSVAAMLWALRAVSALRPGRPRQARLTRAAFWQRLRQGDEIRRHPAGGFVCRGTLPHLTWTGMHRVQLGDDYWDVSAAPPEFDPAGHLVYSYRLVPAGADPDAAAPSAMAYAEEVMNGVRLEWDAFNQGFAWLTCLLAAEVQARAFDGRGGPGRVRRTALATVLGETFMGTCTVLALWGGPAADPLRPLVSGFATALLADSAARLREILAGRYAPSVFRVFLPTHALRPESVSFREHQQAEDAALTALGLGRR